MVQILHVTFHMSHPCIRVEMLPTYTTTQSELLVDLQTLLGQLQANLAYWQERIYTEHARLARLLSDLSKVS